MDYLLRGILIGLLFGLPVGAVGAMTVQSVWSGGIKAGLLTGLGSSIADCFYACVGVFGLTLVTDFLLKYQAALHFIGGSLLLFMGLRLLLRKEREIELKPEPVGAAKLFCSFAVGITNPAAILTFLFAFSYFGISGEAGLLQGILLVCGVFTGTYIWWGFLSAAAGVIKKKGERFPQRYINLIFGTLLALFGLAVFLRLAE